MGQFAAIPLPNIDNLAFRLFMVSSCPLESWVRWVLMSVVQWIDDGWAGPGNCLGLLASKTSPTAVRGQFYGIAAAVGKVGAFVGTWGTASFLERIRFP